MLLGVHLVALPMYPQLPLYVLLMIALFTLLSALAIFKQRPLPGRWARFFLAGLVVAVLLKSYGTIFGQAPGTSMLLMLCFLKLFEMQHKRDVYAVIFITYFLTASHFFHSQSPWMAVFVFIVVVYLTSLLLALSDRLGSTGFNQRIRLSARMVLQAIPLMLIMFMLFPRIPGPLWGLPDTARSARTGLSEEMSPGSINNLIGSGAVAFRVRFDNEPPAHSDLYWRGLVLSDYDGQTWRRDDAPELARPDVIYDESQADIHSYKVTLEPHNKKWLYSLEQVISFETNFKISRELQLTHDADITDVLIYAMSSSLEAVNRGLFEPERIKNLHLPSELNPQTLELASQFRQEAGGETDRLAQRVLAYFRQQDFVYTLSPPLLGNNAMDDFLFETRRGFCGHFTSAFVYLMRAAGVPARVVIGYQGGQLNPLDDYLIVRQSDAHAWAEVWSENRGWFRVDPTAAVSPGRIELGIQAAGVEPALLPSILISNSEFLLRTRYLWDSFHHNWNQWVVGFNANKQQELLSRLGFGGVSARTLLLWLVVAMSLGGGLVALWVFRRVPAAGRDPLRYYYDIFCNKLGRVGIKKAPCEGPREFLMRAADYIPDLKDELTAITRSYLKLRYGNDNNELLHKQFVQSVKRFGIKKSYSKSTD